MIGGLLRRLGAAERPLRTRRLRLVTMTPGMLLAEGVGRWALERELQTQVAADWPPSLWEPAVWQHILDQFRAHPATLGWHRYMISTAPPGEVVGCLGGFAGPQGDVELGYSVADSRQRAGLGTEAVCALRDWLFEQPAVRSVSAQAFQTAPWSIKVMQRCGMQPVGAGDQPGTVRYRCWRGNRPADPGSR